MKRSSDTIRLQLKDLASIDTYLRGINFILCLLLLLSILFASLWYAPVTNPAPAAADSSFTYPAVFQEQVSSDAKYSPSYPAVFQDR